MGDGEEFWETLDNLTSYHWKEPGSYTVTCTAVTRLNQESTTFTVDITDVDEGVGPELVQVKASPTKTTHEVEISVTVVSEAAVDCEFDFGDGTTKDLKGMIDFVNNLKMKNTYPTAGYYTVNLFCDNGYGTGKDTTVAFVQNREVDFVTKITGSDVMIPLEGADVHPEHFRVFLNGQRAEDDTAIRVENHQVTLQGSLFAKSGEYLTQIKAGWFVLHQRVTTLQAEIKSAEIIVDSESVDGTDPVGITFLIHGGDHTHLHIQYGDGKEEYLYYPSGGDPLKVTRTHWYGALGWYEVQILAANDVGFVKASKMVTSERPIENVSVSVANVTELGQPAKFNIQVDMDKKPAMAFYVILEAANNVVENVLLGDKRDKAEAVVFKHVFSDYGIYYFSLKVHNNISHVIVYGLLQVGQNITYVDMTTSTERVEEGQMVVIEIDSPHGSPLTYDVDMDDGNTVSVTIPEDQGSQTSSNENQDPEIKNGEQSEGRIFNTTEIPGKRRKRSAEQSPTVEPMEYEATTIRFVDRNEANNTDENLGDFQNLAAPSFKNKKMVITHRYSEPGRYSVSVRVHNLFNEATTWLCPDIIVVALERDEPECSQFSIDIGVETSLESPLVVARSEALLIPTEPKIDCQDRTSEVVPDFTWKVFRKPNPEVSDEEWRTELEVCATQLGSKDFLMPGNTLWYGTYKLTVTLGMSIKDNTRRSRRQTQNEVDLKGYQPMLKTATQDMYIEVVPSELNASFAGDGTLIDIPKFNVLKLDVSSSYDPDVPQSNKTGMWAEVICYSDSRAPQFVDAYPEDILATGTLDD